MIKKTNLTILLFVLILFTIQGQALPKDFGDVSMDEVELKQDARYKDVEAIVLSDVAKSHFVRTGSSFEVVFERTTRIKIFSDAGIKWAEVEIPFYQDGNVYEKISDIEANSYNNENGLIVKTSLDASNTFNEKLNNSWNVKKLAVPNVKEGTVIEYKYSISSEYMFNLRDWEFQWRIPVVYSEYQVAMIPFYEYSWLLQGPKKLDSQTSQIDKTTNREYGSIYYQDMVHNFVMKDIPPFDSEEFIASSNDYIIKLDFQLAKVNYTNGSSFNIMSTWEELNKELLKHKDFSKYMQKSEKLAPKLLDTKELSLKSDKEKFDQVMQYVKRNYNWDKGHGKYTSKSPDKFIQEKFGNCADINLFTIALLNASGIEAKPVLISTRSNGKIKYNYPFSHFFNYVVIQANIDGEKVLTDATETLSLNNRLPTRCLNDKGLVVQKDIVEWVSLECKFPSELKTDIQIEVIDNEVINSSITKTATEYIGLYYRNKYSDNIKTIKEIVESKDYVVADSSILVQNQTDIEKPYVLTYKQTSKSEVVNDKIYVSPLLSESISENPLKQKERTYPVDMIYPEKRIFNSTILIPEGFKVDYLPAEQTINNDLFELKYALNSDDNQINISFDYYFKRSVYSSNEYSLIKSYFNEIVKRGNEKIVLAKK